MQDGQPFREISEEEIVEMVDSGLLPRKGIDAEAMTEAFYGIQNQIDSELLPDIMGYEWTLGEHNLEDFEDVAETKKESDLKEVKKDVEKAKGEEEEDKDSNEETK